MAAALGDPLAVPVTHIELMAPGWGPTWRRTGAIDRTATRRRVAFALASPPRSKGTWAHDYRPVSEISRYDMTRRILPSARKHGIADIDIVHAIRFAAAVDRYGNRLLYLGPDSAANMLEIVAILEPDGSELVIHAMPMRAKYLPLLRGLGEPHA